MKYRIPIVTLSNISDAEWEFVDVCSVSGLKSALKMRNVKMILFDEKNILMESTMKEPWKKMAVSDLDDEHFDWLVDRKPGISRSVVIAELEDA